MYHLCFCRPFEGIFGISSYALTHLEKATVGLTKRVKITQNVIPAVFAEPGRRWVLCQRPFAQEAVFDGVVRRSAN